MNRLIGALLVWARDSAWYRWVTASYDLARRRQRARRQTAYLAQRATTWWLERGDQLKRYAAGQHEIDAQRGYVDWDEWDWLAGQFSHWGQCTLDYARKELKAPTREGR